MKKFITIVCCFCFILTGAVFFTACGEDKNPTEISIIINNTAKYIAMDSAANLNVDDEWFNYENQSYKESSHLDEYISGDNGLLKLLNDWYRNDYNESLFKKTQQKNGCYFKLTSDSIYAYRDSNETLEALALKFQYGQHAVYGDNALTTKIYYTNCSSSLITYNISFVETPLANELSEITELDIDYEIFKEAISHKSLPYIKANIFDSYTYKLLNYSSFHIINEDSPELYKSFAYTFRQSQDYYCTFSFIVNHNEKNFKQSSQYTDDGQRSWQYYTIQEFSSIVEDILA